MARKIIGAFLLAVFFFSAVRTAFADSPVTLGRGSLTSIALSPDGTRLAVGTTIGLYFYNAQTFEPQGFWEIAAVTRLVWSPRGDMLAVFESNSIWATPTLSFRVIDTGAVLWRVAPKDWRERASDIAFSPDGSQVAVAHELNLFVHDAYQGSIIYKKTLSSNNWLNSYVHLAYAPNGVTLAACCIYGRTELLNTSLWQVQTILGIGSGRMQFNHDGQQLLVGTSVWDIVQRRKVASFFPDEEVRSIAFSPDGSQVALGTGPGLVRIWPMGSPHPRLILRGHATRVTSVIWSPDNTILYSAGGNTIRAWDVNSGVQLRVLDGFTDSINHVAWSADGQRVIAQQGNHVGAWDVASRMPVQAGWMGQATDWNGNLRWQRATDLATSPAGDKLAVADRTGITLYDANTLTTGRRLPTGYQIVMIAFSSDGRYLASVGNSPFAVVWDTATGTPVHTLLGSDNNFWNVALAFNNEVNTLYVLESTGLLRRWDLATQTSTTVQTPIPQVFYGRYFDPAIHPETQRIATERGAGGIDVANTTNGQLQYNLNAPQLRSIIINPQGTRMAAIVENNVQVWDLASGTLLAKLASSSTMWRAITDVAFSFDGSRLAMSNADGTVKIYTVP